MNGLIRFSLIILAVGLLFYVMNQRSSPIKNDGDVTVSPTHSVVDNVVVPDTCNMYEREDDVPVEYPVPGSPDAMTGAGISNVNWDGLGENQLNGALSKQYQELDAGDLLPHNDMAHWADIYPSGVGQLQNKNFLHAGHHVGINTVGQTLKNPNLQLRSEPANPQIQVSPWQQSSYGPDLLRRPLEISACD